MRLFTEREIRLIIVGVAASTVLSISVAIIVSLSRNAATGPAVTGTVDDRFVLRVTDLAVPDDLDRFSMSDWYEFRPPLSRWNVEQIERFWIDPSEIELERVADENDRRIRELFQRIP